MPAPESYAITEALSRGRRGVVYRAVRKSDGHRVILKVLDPQLSRVDDVKQLEHEYEVGSLFDSPAIVRPLALETYGGMPALVMDDSGATSLERRLGKPMPIGQFLELAVRIVAALAELHERYVIHRDLKPANILVDDAGNVTIADLGMASRIPRGRANPQDLTRIEGSLPYLSPEQTGRMNRSVDARADLYALGVTFYEMLTGTLPFVASDPLEWVHCHVAFTPRPLREVVAEIPQGVSDVVMKLLAKLPDDRYQTARGLQHDLEACRCAWNRHGDVPPFPLASADVSDRFEIPEKLYGREREVAALEASFDRVATTGAPELMLVSGYAGIGKSSLVRELQLRIARARGLFSSGKFDQYKRDVPYATVAQAFADLVDQILTESEERLAAWRSELRSALGASAQLIVDVIPRLELVIGPQPPVVSVPPLEAQNRFRRVFGRFVRVFARREHPLVLFFDDIQWIDSGSLRLVTDILRDGSHALLIGAYRSSEVEGSHPLASALSELREMQAAVHEVVLGSLGLDAIRQLVADTVHRPPAEVARLAALVHEKTAGNPFFAIQFLTTLYQEGLLDFDRASGQWCWDVERIRAKGFTDNVLELLALRVNRLLPETREMLRVAACVGNRFDLSTLAVVSRRSEEDTARALRDAVVEGLVLQSGDTFAFVHDRVQQAVYALDPSVDLRAVHLDIGRLLLRSLDPERVAERIFEIVTQLNRGADLMTDPTERRELARLDLVAGRRAKAAIAYFPARALLGKAAAQLSEEDWTSRYELAFAIWSELAECEYLCGRFDDAEARFSELLTRARTDLDKASVYGRRMQLCQVASKFDEAVELGLTALRLLGVEIPDDDAALAEAIRSEVEVVRESMEGRSIAELANVPEATDPMGRARIALLANLTAPAYVTRPMLIRLVVLKLVGCTLAFGPTDEACFAYCAYGMLLVSMFDDARAADELSRMGLELGRRLGDVRWRGAALFVRGTFVSSWLHPFSTTSRILEEGFLACLDAGDLVFASYVASVHAWHAVERGDSLADVRDLAARYMAYTRAAYNQANYLMVVTIEHFAACLMGHTRDRLTLDDDTFDEEPTISRLQGTAYRPASVHYRVMKMIVAYLAGDDRLVLEHVAEARKSLDAVTAMPVETTLRYIHALALARLNPTLDPAVRQANLEELAEHEERLGRWASRCPQNFQTKYALVCAEIARITGDERTAERQYEAAVQSARSSGLVHWEAIASERAASFHRERGLETIADAYLRAAFHGYVRWGAETKVRALEMARPGLHAETAAFLGTTFAGRAEYLDLLSVAKALQTISSVMVQDELVQTLLDVVLEEGSARRALLIRPREGRARVEAEVCVDRDASSRERVEAGPRVPLSLVQYVLRTGERIVLDEPALARRFGQDPYFARVRPKSVLCLPIKRHGEVAALLYLENELVPGAFTAERLVALELLAAQAAISLENARLLRETQQALRVREEFISLASHELRTPLTSVRMLVEALVEAKASGKDLRGEVLDRSYRRILRGVDRLEQLAGELLDASLLERGELELRPSVTDLRAVVQGMLKRLEPDLKAAGCTVTVDAPSPVVGRWDRVRLEQVVRSLLSNAMKFGRRGPIEVSVLHADAVAQLVIEDHGSGIDEARMRRLFERFERGVPVQHFGGFGLGLYISRRIVHAHGGTIRVESAPGIGTRVRVELPCPPGDAAL